MEAWHIWVIVALVFVIVEIFTSGFAVICISFGSIFGAIVSAFDMGLQWQFLAFAVGTILSFFTIRPVVQKFLYRKSREVKTNVDALIGRRAIVSERIGGELHPGRVKVDGDDWKAISINNEVIEEGEAVEITSINSIIVTVKKL